MIRSSQSIRIIIKLTTCHSTIAKNSSFQPSKSTFVKTSLSEEAAENRFSVANKNAQGFCTSIDRIFIQNCDEKVSFAEALKEIDVECLSIQTHGVDENQPQSHTRTSPCYSVHQSMINEKQGIFTCGTTVEWIKYLDQDHQALKIQNRWFRVEKMLGIFAISICCKFCPIPVLKKVFPEFHV